MEQRLSPQETRQGMIVSVMEGALYTVWFSLIGNNFLTGFMLHLGATDGQIGLTASLQPLSSLSMIFAAVILGRLSRRKPFLMATAYGHRILWSLAGFVPLLLPQSYWVWTYLVIYFIANLCISLAVPAWQSIMADMVPPDIRGRYFGYRSAVSQVTTVITTLLAGYWLDMNSGYDGFLWLYVLSLAAGIMNVTAFRWQPEPPFVQSRIESPLQHIKQPFLQPAFRQGALFATLLVMAGAVIIPFYPVQMIKGLHLGYGVIAQVTVVATLAGIAANVALGRVLDRVGVHRVLSLMPLAGALIPLLWLAIGPQSTVMLYLAWALHGAAQAVQMLALTTLSFGMSPRSFRPIFLAVFSALSGLGGFLAPIFGGQLSERFPFPVLVAASVVMYGAAGLLWWARTRHQVVRAMASAEV